MGSLTPKQRTALGEKAAAARWKREREKAVRRQLREGALLDQGAPAMASGVTSWQWTVADVVAMLDKWEEQQEKASAQEKAKAAKPSGLVPIKRPSGGAVASGQTKQT